MTIRVRGEKREHSCSGWTLEANLGGSPSKCSALAAVEAASATHVVWPRWSCGVTVVGVLRREGGAQERSV